MDTPTQTHSSGRPTRSVTVPAFLHLVAHPDWKQETRFLRAYLVDRGLASAKDMGLPKLKPGTGPGPVPATAREMRENPSRRTGHVPATYTDLALMEYAQTGE